MLPPVLALLALFVFAWVLAGVFLGGTDDQKPVAHRSEIAQANGPGGSDPAAPEVDNPNVDSYAAYRSKDPFRQIFAFARTTPKVRLRPGSETPRQEDQSEMALPMAVTGGARIRTVTACPIARR